MIVNKKKIKTLICVLGQTRAQDITWESFNKYLLESLGADLALCVAEKKNKNNHMYKNAKYIWKYKDSADYTEYFEKEVMPQFTGNTDYCIKSKYNWDRDKLLTSTIDLGNTLRKKLNIPIADMDAVASKMFKKVYHNPPRSMLVTEKDSQGRIKYKSIK